MDIRPLHGREPQHDRPVRRHEPKDVVRRHEEPRDRFERHLSPRELADRKVYDLRYELDLRRKDLREGRITEEEFLKVRERIDNRIEEVWKELHQD